MTMNILFVYLGITLAIVALWYFWYLRYQSRQQRYARRKSRVEDFYRVIPSDTEIVLTNVERRHYFRIGIGAIVLWIVGVSVALLPDILTFGPFYFHHAQPVSVTVVDVQTVRERKTLAFNRVTLAAQIGEEVHEDVWTVPTSRFHYDIGETVSGEWYQDDSGIQLGIADGIHPFIRLRTVVGIAIMTLLLGAFSFLHLRIATKKTVLFSELSFVDKQLRVNKLKK